MKILGVIPSRYASTRFPGKPLADIAGKTVVARVYEQALKAQRLHRVAIATDHPKIYEHAQALGALAYMTSPNHPSGTDRCHEALGLLDEPFDYVVNIQGDEPFIAPEQIDELAAALDGEAQLATLIKRVTSYDELASSHVVKVIANSNGEAIYFSRSIVPYMAHAPAAQWPARFPYFKHIGLYAYRTDVLAAIAALPASPLEVAESLEQLRWIENGYSIKVVQTVYESLEVDTPEDLAKILERMGKAGSSPIGVQASS